MKKGLKEVAAEAHYRRTPDLDHAACHQEGRDASGFSAALNEDRKAPDRPRRTQIRWTCDQSRRLIAETERWSITLAG